ncbi:LysR family transcriptional regulator [Jiella mangrovi]|uniref:LysR family transcriptional regulator n=1 Tax=Jiella mangrovi TaxID=2821407 RepID=A0ABS4BJK0_9HYPH|nr:LysR family transcriptional regulator [Jiella mangrovi]MBP0616876.1 LysR family transcriptional regulator [Jiella mangrovi]
MRHLDTETLATLVAIIDTGSFTQAADRVSKSQAAVSSAIARLEDRIGKRLLNRTNRTVSLTPAGEILTDFARRLLALEEEALSALGGDVTAGRVRLGMPDDYLGLFGALVMENFRARHPEIHVEVVCEFSHHLEPLVATGDLDLAIVTRQSDDGQGSLLKRERQIWCAARQARPETEPILPLALFPDHCRARPHILKALSAANRDWRIVWTSSHLQSIQSAVMMGFAVTALPLSALTFEHRELGEGDGLPALPELELALISAPSIGLAARRLASFLRSEFSPDRPD